MDDVVIQGTWSPEEYKLRVNVLEAKTELRETGAAVLMSIKIPALGPILGPWLEDDRDICLMRALKIYLSKTKKSEGR